MPEVSRERALASDSRVALLEALQGGGEALDASELAAAVGLHVNTVRSHLSVLERAGLVTRHAEPRTLPGRPRQLYRASAPSAEEPDRYRLMARMLASYIAATAPDPAAAAEETGRQWGRHLVPMPPPFVTTSEDEARELLLRLLGDLGFAPRLASDRCRVDLRPCPFREVAESHPEVACSLHLGLMRGALAQVDAPLEVSALEPFVEPDRCVAHLAEAGS